MSDIPVVTLPTAAQHLAQVDPFNAEQAIAAKLPVFDNPKKGEYLLYRAMDFSIREAVILVNISEKIVRRWRVMDEAFKDWEVNRLGELQGRLAPTLLTAQFMRCMHLSLTIDSQVLSKARFNGLDTLTENEYDWAKKASDRYKAQDLLALQRSLLPMREDGTGTGDVNLTVNVGNDAIDHDRAYQLGVKDLLEKFRVNRNVIDNTWGPSDDASPG